MDIEFHYYMTYLIAAKAGLGSDEALKLAYSAQYVDDNDMIFEIDKDRSGAYRNYISQTMNILQPKKKLFRIYPLFHFIPGDAMAESAYRKDGKMHWLNTTPNSDNAQKIFQIAIESKDIYRIGIACHSYADTWAHQNFVGYYDGFNAIQSPLGEIIPNIGHADARHNPDEPALVWRDTRVIAERRDNKALFLDAAANIFGRLAKMAAPTVKNTTIEKRAEILIHDLGLAIGERDQSNSKKEERIGRYRQLSLSPDYGGREVPIYDEDLWLDSALNEDVRGLRDRSDRTWTRFDPFQDVYTWKRGDYKQSPWYLFQEAVKNHQNAAWEILSQKNLKGLQLPEF
jgi:hypothetical protein